MEIDLQIYHIVVILSSHAKVEPKPDDGIAIKFEHEFIECSAELVKSLIKKMKDGNAYCQAYKSFKGQLKVKLVS